MITKADIKQETNSVSYNRGKKIYEEQRKCMLFRYRKWRIFSDINCIKLQLS